MQFQQGLCNYTPERCPVLDLIGSPCRTPMRKPDARMPDIAQGEDVQKIGEKMDEKQTKPPKRYSEASLAVPEHEKQ